MARGNFSERMMRIAQLIGPVDDYISRSAWSEHREDPEACDFMFGNPQEMPLEGFTAALQKWLAPQNKDWFAYKNNEPGPRQVVADSLRDRLGLAFEPEDIFLTPGVFGALPLALAAAVDPGDEVIYISPPWFFYETMIMHRGGTPVRARCHPETHDLDLEAIERALTPRTRAVIVNSPNNPTGRIYPRETLHALADLLRRRSAEIGQTIFIISDESYRRILFDGRSFHSPVEVYGPTFMLYTYGKTLLTPGQRIGYLALPPDFPDREVMRLMVNAAQYINGYAFPNALLQHALGDLEELSIDIPRLQRKRDWMVSALREQGYQLHTPEATFYLLVRSPLEDDVRFTEMLSERGVYCLPGSMFDTPGYFRVSLTATEDMIERALPVFSAVMQAAAQPGGRPAPAPVPRTRPAGPASSR